MGSVKEHIRQLEESGAVEPGRISKLAAAAFKLEIGERAMHPIEAVKEMVGIKKPLHERALQYVAEGIEQAKPRAGLAVVGAGAALAVAGIVKTINNVRFNAALEDMKQDPDVQADMERAMSIAQMVRRWAPSIAADKSVLKGTVKNLLKFPDSYITYDIASKLSDAEKKFSATHGIFAALKERVL